MTKTDQLCRSLGIVLSRRQVYACEYLEGKAHRFGIEFGVTNCEQKAADAWVGSFYASPLRAVPQLSKDRIGNIIWKKRL